MFMGYVLMYKLPWKAVITGGCGENQVGDLGEMVWQHDLLEVCKGEYKVKGKKLSYLCTSSTVVLIWFLLWHSRVPHNTLILGMQQISLRVNRRVL